jgi:hypothetical protein
MFVDIQTYTNGSQKTVGMFMTYLQRFTFQQKAKYTFRTAGILMFYVPQKKNTSVKVLIF